MTEVEQALYEIDHPGSVLYSRATHALAAEVRRLQGESHAYKLRICSIEIALACLLEDEPLTMMPKKRYEALVADADRLAEVVWRYYAHPSCQCSQHKEGDKCLHCASDAAIAEHKKLTKQTEEKPCSMTPESPTT